MSPIDAPESTRHSRGADCKAPDMPGRGTPRHGGAEGHRGNLAKAPPRENRSVVGLAGRHIKRGHHTRHTSAGSWS